MRQLVHAIGVPQSGCCHSRGHKSRAAPQAISQTNSAVRSAGRVGHGVVSVDHAVHLVRRTALAESIATMDTKPVLHGDNGSTRKTGGGYRSRRTRSKRGLGSGDEQRLGI